MTRQFGLFLGSIFAAATLSVAAHADTVDTFNASITEGGSTYTFLFTLPASPSVSNPGAGFTLPVTVTASYGNYTSVKFFASNTDGISFESLGSARNFAFGGPVLFTTGAGGTSFLTGNFSVTDFDSGSAGPLSITQSVTGGATPEPSSLALLGTGLTGVLTLLRRRRLR